MPEPTYLDETTNDEDLEEDDESRPPWRLCEFFELPEPLAQVAVARANDLARSLQLDLDTSGFEPLLAASCFGCVYSGVSTISWEALRLVGPVRFGGADALLIAQMVIDETEDPAIAALGHPSVIRIVPSTGVDQAERVLLAQEPGFRLL